MVSLRSGCVVIGLLLVLSTSLAAQQHRQGVRLSGDLLAASIPVSAFVVTLVQQDYQGIKQLIFSGASTLALTYALKFAVHKERPDQSNHLSFPSSHTSMSMMGATFVQRRYGWHYGLPVYILSTYVAWSRVYARKHDVWDVMGGALVGIGCSILFTRPFATRYQLVMTPVIFDQKPGIYASFHF